VLGGTFHSVAYRLLRRHSAALGLGDADTVIDGSDLADLIVRGFRTLGTNSNLGARSARAAR